MKKIRLNDLSLKQKIAQMIIVRAEIKGTYKLLREDIGGIFLDRQKTPENYKKIIDKFQENSRIPLFVATDMEGAWNPFSAFKKFPKFSEIKSKDEAYEVGLEEGILMKKLGFNMNFSPVAEYKDIVYGGRTFSGTKKEIKEKLGSYIKGLQKNVLSICKHYPGKNLIKNLHFRKDKQKITEDDLDLFRHCFKCHINGVMLGHLVVYGAVNSNGKPSSVSKEVINSLRDSQRNFSGLIVSDEINMAGLRKFYLFNKKAKYRDLINAGENIILDFKLTYRRFNRLFKRLEKEVLTGKIDTDKINESVKKILETKGYKVVVR